MALPVPYFMAGLLMYFWQGSAQLAGSQRDSTETITKY
jgi:hypothetical protein